MSKESNRSILVTGGAGFIGSHVTQALLARGWQVLIVDDFNDYYDPRLKRANVALYSSHPAVRVEELDICDQPRLRRLVGDFHPAVILHLAAYAGVTPSIQRPLLYEQVNIGGTLNLLEVAREFGIRDFVFGSSSSVYGGNDKVPFAETDPVEKPLCPYAATKRAGELLAYTYSRLHGLRIRALRFFTVYGPRQRPDMAIHSFIRRIDHGEPITLFGARETRRDYTYVDDIVQGILGAIDHEFDFEVFNLGESQTVSLPELIAIMEELLGRQAQVSEGALRPGEAKITYADIGKARQLLGYSPHTDIREGLRRTVEWYRAEEQL